MGGAILVPKAYAVRLAYVAVRGVPPAAPLPAPGPPDRTYYARPA
ncbi:hypothetical protein [Streptomyces sp. NPDC046805]